MAKKKSKSTAKRTTRGAVIDDGEKSRLLALFGVKLKALRKGRRLSLKKLSLGTGITLKTLGSYELGEKEPKLVDIMLIAKALKVSHLELADIW